MTRLFATALVLLCLAIPAFAQGTGRMTIETGGETHKFSASGAWQDTEGLSSTFQVQIDGAHPDGSSMFLDFVASNGQASDILFRFREPDTADFYGREWIEGPGFRVTLSEFRQEGDVITVAGQYRGQILDPNAPGSATRVQGSFSVDLVEPVYSPT